MDGSIQLSAEQRNMLLKLYRCGDAATASRRAHVILLVADGWSFRQIRAILFASFDLICDCIRRFRKNGTSGLADVPAQVPTPAWVAKVVRWLREKTPEDFGYFRSRWSCATLAEVLAWETGVSRSAETIRRGLQRAGFVWRRPRPVLGRVDPAYDTKLQEIHDLLDQLPANETAVFEDEVDVHLNPKIGSCWMPRGDQTQVVTPGDNVKRHLAGSLVWRTGTLLLSPAGSRRNAELFVAHLDDLRCRIRGYHVIHVICDNATFHNCRLVREYLEAWGHRIRLHFLPKYAPETNPIERIWWRLHETITRNHRCQTIEQLLDNVYDWVDAQPSFFTPALGQYTMAA